MTTPYVTLTLFLYNQERFARDAVQSALNQTYSPLKIVISDDGSSDTTFDVVRETVAGYDGPHEVVLNRNPRNLGVAAHVNHIFSNFVDTRYVVYQDGDDISEPVRAAKMVAHMVETGLSAVYSSARVIDGEGAEQGVFSRGFSKPVIGFDDFIHGRFWFCGGLAAYDMKIFEHFGPLDEQVYNEDFDLAVRALVTGGVGYLDEHLSRYRIHGNNLSFWMKMENAGSLARAIEVRRESLMERIKNYENIFKYLREEQHKKFVSEKLRLFTHELRSCSGLSLAERVAFIRSEDFGGLSWKKKLKYGLMSVNHMLYFLPFVYWRKSRSGFSGSVG